MPILVKIIGFIIAIAGIVFAIYPIAINKFVEFAKVEKRVYIGGVVRLVFGVILLFSASLCNIPWFVTLLGIAMLVSGVLIFTMGIEKIHGLLDWFNAKSIVFHRIWAIVAALIGLILIFAA